MRAWPDATIFCERSRVFKAQVLYGTFLISGVETTEIHLTYTVFIYGNTKTVV
jgi:hypothetical protein